MAHICPDCHRPNAPHREQCLYCGGTLPEPTVAPPSRSEPNLPPDIDQLVKQAMTLGTTHKLREAMKTHKEAPVEAVAIEATDIPHQTLLHAIRDAANDAVAAFDENREEALNLALACIQSNLAQWGPIGVAEDGVSVPDEDEPIICLPQVRRGYGLVVEGIGNVDRHGEFVEALGMDGATARMLAIARQPRIAIRGDDRIRLEDMAKRLRQKAGGAAAVIDHDHLRG